MAGHTALPFAANMPVAADLTALPSAALSMACETAHQAESVRGEEGIKSVNDSEKLLTADLKDGVQNVSVKSGAGAKPVAAGLAALPFAALPSRPERQASRDCPKRSPTAEIAQVRRKAHWQKQGRSKNVVTNHALAQAPPVKPVQKERGPVKSGAGARPDVAGLAALPFAALPSRPKRQA